MKSPLEFTILSALTVPVALVARADVYMSDQQAALTMLPGAKLQEKKIDLTDDEVKQIEDKSGESVRDKQVHVWMAKNGSAVFIDRVIGKHDFITYAVAIQPDKTGVGKVRGIEVLEYRETYGSQIRRPEWRQQFVGKGTDATLKNSKDIQNISGATLSCTHVTDGVRRVLRTYEVLRARHA